MTKWACSCLLNYWITPITTLTTVQIDQISGVIREEGDKKELSLQLKFFDKMQRSLKTELKEGPYYYIMKVVVEVEHKAWGALIMSILISGLRRIQ